MRLSILLPSTHSLQGWRKWVPGPTTTEIKGSKSPHNKLHFSTTSTPLNDHWRNIAIVAWARKKAIRAGYRGHLHLTPRKHNSKTLNTILLPVLCSDPWSSHPTMNQLLLSSYHWAVISIPLPAWVSHSLIQELLLSLQERPGWWGSSIR